MNLRASMNGVRSAAIAAMVMVAWASACTLQTEGELEVTGGGGAGHDASAGTGGVAGTGHGGASTGGTAGKGGGLSGGSGGGSGGGTGGTGGTGGSGGSGGGASGTGGSGGSGGGASGSGGSGGGATGGASGTGGAGGAVGPEDCSNGKDDNQDSLVDCADPLCTPGFICVPAPPAGWSTVTYQRDRAAGTAPTDCGALQSSGLSLFHGVDSPAAGCDCACGPVTGGQCSGGATLYQYSNCSGGSAAQTSGCFDFHASGWTIGGVRATTASVTTAGTCPATSSGTPQAATWKSALDLCNVPALGTGCGAGSVCVPKPAAPLDNLACIERSGQPGCPTEYPLQTFYFESFTDNRACTSSGCSCAAATGQTCDFTLALYTDASCGTTPAGTYPLDGACHATGFGSSYIDSSRFLGAINGGTCQPSGTAGLSGDVTPTAPHTVCCKSL